MKGQAQIPLFPLHTVLPPGGLLPLRIFEPRYLDMVRDCSRDDSGFGVCLLLPETGDEGPRHHARIGTLAKIGDFYTLEDGLLGITAQGLQRFRIAATGTRDNGLLVGNVNWLREAEVVPVPDECRLLVDITARLMEKVGDHYPGHDAGALEDANWVSWRLTELLPLDPLEKQVLLELSDPVARLHRLLRAVPDLLPGDGDE